MIKLQPICVSGAKDESLATDMTIEEMREILRDAIAKCAEIERRIEADSRRRLVVARVIA